MTPEFLIVHTSESKSKVEAVHGIIDPFLTFLYFGPIRILHEATPSGVGRQLTTLHETILGAKSRAESAFEKHSPALSIAMESGLIQIPCSTSGLGEQCVAYLYDGKQRAIGLSSCWELPPKVASILVADRCSFTQAFAKAGVIPGDHKHGESDTIGLLTSNLVTRKIQCEQALHMAFIRFMNPETYRAFNTE